MLFGDNFMARDAYGFEKEYNFGSKPLGFANTEHVVKIPDGYRKIVGLASWSIKEKGSTEKIDEEEIFKLRHQVSVFNELVIFYRLFSNTLLGL